ncbi:Proteasome subunit beta type-7 [Coelomomyces lativittatus]|nr:Proteasome subunit beta type-7 [Coelomomyces lativittatus]KAJ1501545.1 Proteasome subunit beta type-7 [Coelomomyces lativittatus]
MTLDYYLSSPYEGHSSLLGQEHSTNVDVHHHLTPSLVGLSSTNHELMRSAYQHTSSPMVTGTSVVALKYKDGIMMATDCLASYGSLARFRNVQRMVQVGASTVIGVSGEVSDFQYLQHVLLHHVIEDHEHQDGHVWQPSHLHTYLHRLMYQRRSQMKFLLNTVVVAGLDHGQRW